MRETRKPEEAIIDKALILVLMSLVSGENQDPLVGDRLKCMKLPFLAANQMFEQRAKGFNLTFFRYDQGPLSRGVYSAWNHLTALGFLVEDKHGLRITGEGGELAKAIFNDILCAEGNQFFRQTIENVAHEYGRLPTRQIMRMVYDTKVTLPRSNKRMTIRDVGLNEDIILVLEEEEANICLELEGAWMETLAIELDPRNKEGLLRAFSDYRDGKVFSHEEVWRDVRS